MSVADDIHFLMSLSVDLTNRGEEYYGKRCKEIALAIEHQEQERNHLIELAARR